MSVAPPEASARPDEDPRADVASLSERLASFSCRTSFDDLDGAARERARVHLLDWVACAWAGAATAPGRVFLELARSQPESGRARAVGLDDPTSARQAALVNGALSKASQLDDMDRGSIVHPAVAVCPAALAAAEERGARGRALLRAVVLGYETACRIGRAAGPGHYDHWHSTGTCGVFGAALAAGLLYGLDRDRLAAALAIAGAQSAGLIQCVIDDVPEGLFLHSGKAASDGVLAARLAELGLPGARHVLEGDAGFLAATSPEPRPREITDGLGDGPHAWAITSVSTKRWPSCMYTHTAVQAARRLAARAPGPYERVTVETTRHGCSIVDKPRPADVREARYSLQFGVAVALLGRPFDGRVFTEDVLRDPAVAELMRLVDVRHSPAMEAHFPERWPARVRLRTATGEELDETVLDMPGGPDDPMSFDDVAAKLAEVVGDALPPATVGQVVDAVADLERDGPVEAVLAPLVRR